MQNYSIELSSLTEQTNFEFRHQTCQRMIYHAYTTQHNKFVTLYALVCFKSSFINISIKSARPLSFAIVVILFQLCTTTVIIIQPYIIRIFTTKVDNLKTFDNATYQINTAEAKQSMTVRFIPAVLLLRPYFRDRLSSVCRLNWYKVMSLAGTADKNLHLCKSQIYSSCSSEQQN